MLLPLLLLSLLFNIPSAWCSPRNVTVDDELGDSETGQVPTYKPSGVWNQGATCTGCFVQLDKSLTFDGTWHDSTYAPNDEPYTVEINFTGTAVYTFFALANFVQFATTLTNVSFTLDDNIVGTFEHIPTTSTDFIYKAPVYVNESLENVPHNFLITAIGPDSANNSLILFDNLIYTADDEASSTSTSSSFGTSTSTTQTSSGSGQNTGPTNQNIRSGPNKSVIIGGAIAAVIVLAAAIFIFIGYRRKKRSEPRIDLLSSEETRALSDIGPRPIAFALRQEETPSFSTQSEMLDTISTTYLTSQVDGNSDANTSTNDATARIARSKTSLRGQELVGRIAWLEEEVDRLQTQLEGHNHYDTESLPGYSDIAYTNRTP